MSPGKTFISIALLITAFFFFGIKYAKDLPPTEKEVLTNLANFQIKPEKTPNIFLIITDKKQNRAICSNTFPSIFSNKKNNFIPSLFSLFYGEPSTFFKYRKNSDWTSGSTPLRLLLKLGYKIHVISNLMLHQENIEELLFGKDRHLTQSFTIFGKNSKETIFPSLNRTLLENNAPTQKNLFAIFLQEHQDKTFNQLVTYLKKHELYEESIIVTLSDLQKKSKNKKSLYLKLGSFKEERVENQVTQSYEYIFPTILHYLFEKKVTQKLLTGHSHLYSAPSSNEEPLLF